MWGESLGRGWSVSFYPSDVYRGVGVGGLRCRVSDLSRVEFTGCVYRDFIFCWIQMLCPGSMDQSVHRNSNRPTPTYGGM